MKFLLFLLFIPSAGLVAQPETPKRTDAERQEWADIRRGHRGDPEPRPEVILKPDFPSKEWKTGQEAAIAEAKQSKDPQKAIELLSQVLLDTPRFGGICGNVSAETLKKYQLDAALAEDMARKAARVLAGIPGHADHQKVQILEAAARFNLMQSLRARRDASNQFMREQHRITDVLGRVRSVESIRILGELLGDQSDREVVAFETKVTISKVLSSSELVPEALHGLKFRSQVPVWGTSEAWKDWYGEVKAGTRTFSFEGDPQVYDLNGPVAEEKNPVLRDAR